ncbi:MAG: hypothetical protein JW863_15030 [Chitinispirillaceae bacterium]|nr:hypothetical protein [Chitinispirillaceae bacterium]
MMTGRYDGGINNKIEFIFGEDYDGLASILSLGYLSLSIATREHFYKKNRSKIFMNYPNAMTSTALCGFVGGLLVGLIIFPDNTTYFDTEWRPFIAALCGSGLGALSGIYFGYKYPGKSVVYYPGPVVIGVLTPILAFTINI